MRRSLRFPSVFLFSRLISAFCLCLAMCCCSPLKAQLTPTTSTGVPAFLAAVALKYPAAALLSSVTLNANATWTVGSLKESGTATLQANGDGSSSLQLNLDTATRSEVRSALGSSRACQWTDSKGTHSLNDVDCNASVAWFAPALSIQPSTAVLPLISITDGGQVTRSSGVFQDIRYQTSVTGATSDVTAFFTTGTQMDVLYDLQALLPNSIEYLQHADNDLGTTFRVRTVYSNYQTVAGVPVPYQIDRYVNGVLQLSLTVTSASLK